MCFVCRDKYKFASKLEVLRRGKANSSLNNLVCLDTSSPSTVDVVLSCLNFETSFIVFLSNAEEEEGNDEHPEENDAEQYDTDFQK